MLSILTSKRLAGIPTGVENLIGGLIRYMGGALVGGGGIGGGGGALVGGHWWGVGG